MGNQCIRFCTSADGTRIAYATHGRGPPLVRVANWLTDLEEEWQSPIWRPRLTALGTRYRMIRYDCRDTGLSDRDVGRVSLDAWVEDLGAVVDAAGLQRVPLLGMGEGGAIAIAFAAQHPERVERLVLCGSFAVGRAKRKPARQDEVDALATLLELCWAEENAAVRQMITTRMIPDGSPSQMSWLNDLQRWAASAEAAVRSYRTATAIDVTEQARSLAVPTIVLHALGDSMVPFEAGRQLTTIIPDSSLVPLDSNNHVLLEEEPAWQRFLAEVDRFLGRAKAPEAAPFSGLTARERELLGLMAIGLSNSAIADRLVISPRTVRNHVTHIFGKLGIETRAEAIVLAREAGVVAPRGTLNDL